MQNHFQNPQSVIDFMLAGNATVTLHSRKSDKHYTYKVRKDSRKGPGSPWFVNILTGPNNESDFHYMGIIPDGEKKEIVWTNKSWVKSNSPSFMGFRYVFERLMKGIMPQDVAIYHDGRCGRCGRTLTTPESVLRGIGPECAKHI